MCAEFGPAGRGSQPEPIEGGSGGLWAPPPRQAMAVLGTPSSTGAGACRIGGAHTEGGKGKHTETSTRTMTVRGAARWLSARRLALVYQHGSCRTRASHQRDQASGRGAHHHGSAHRRLGLPLPPVSATVLPNLVRAPEEPGGRTGQGRATLICCADSPTPSAESAAAGQEIDRCSENSSLNASS